MRLAALPIASLLAFVAVSHAQPAADKKPRPTLLLDTGAHRARIRRVAFTPDGKTVVTASRDKSIRIWDVSNGETVRVVRLALGPGYQGMVQAMDVSPDGRYLAAATLPYGMGQSGFPI